MTEPRGALRRLLELLGLAALAVTQPVLSAFGDGAEEFIFRGISTPGIVAFSLLVAVGPALIWWFFEETLRNRFGSLGESAADLAHGFAVLVLAAATVSQIVKGATGWPAVVVAVSAIVGGIAVTFARWREPITSTVFALLSLFALVSVSVFLFFSPASDILFDDGTANAARVDMGAPAPVVLIILDELPTLSLLDDRGLIDPDRWPTFAALANESSWFRNHTGVAPSTPTAVPAILSGRYPTDIDALPVVDEHPQNLFTMLAGTHDLRVHESVTRICPSNVCEPGAGSDSGFLGSYRSLLVDAFDIFIERTKPSRSVSSGVDFRVPQSDPSADRKIGEWLDRLRPTENPHLDVIHTVLPHQPWWRLPSGQVYGGGDEGAPVVANGLDTQEYSWIGSFVAESARNRHLLQTRFADDQLGIMLDQLRANGTYDESLVIVTVDHGVAFNLDEPIRGLSTGNETEVMWTPLFVKTPGQIDGQVIDSPVSAVDVVPTIADVLDFDLPWEVDGRSVFAPVTDRPDTRFFADWFLNLLEPSDGVLVEVDGEAGFQRLLEAKPPGPIDLDDPWGFYRFGEFGHLLGLPVSDFVVEALPLAGGLNDSVRFLDVDPAAPTIPAYVHGTAPLARGDRVVIALNGTIAGWAEIVGTAKGAGWFTVVPPTAFVNGNNVVELYQLPADADRTTDPASIDLQQLDLAPS